MEKVINGVLVDPARDAGPWYREPWPWILMAGPALVVVAGIYTTVLAVTSDDGLVAADYYKRGLAVNQVLAREERARQLRVRAELFLLDGEARVHLDSADAPPSALRLRLVHPTRAGEDAEALLARGADGDYHGRVNFTAGAVRLATLEDLGGAWRVNGEIRKGAAHAMLGEP